VRVDFYLLSRDPLEKALPQIARSVKKVGQRLLVVSGDEGQRAALDRALWEYHPEDFLAHGHAGEPHEARQPLLLSDACHAPNGARLIAFTDGVWRDEAFAFERALLFFDQNTIDNARGTWRMLGNREDVDRRFWKQEGGRWVEGP
jgi:DNA polymerase III subunit chi